MRIDSDGKLYAAVEEVTGFNPRDVYGAMKALYALDEQEWANFHEWVTDALDMDLSRADFHGEMMAKIRNILATTDKLDGTYYEL